MTDTPDLALGERLTTYGDRFLILGTADDDMRVASHEPDGSWRRARLCVEERGAILAAWAEAKPGEPVFVYGHHFAIGGATRSAVRRTPDGDISITGPVLFDVLTGEQTLITPPNAVPPPRPDGTPAVAAARVHPALTHGIALGPKPPAASVPQVPA